MTDSEFAVSQSGTRNILNNTRRYSLSCIIHFKDVYFLQINPKCLGCRCDFSNVNSHSFLSSVRRSLNTCSKHRVFVTNIVTALRRYQLALKTKRRSPDFDFHESPKRNARRKDSPAKVHRASYYTTYTTGQICYSCVKWRAYMYTWCPRNVPSIEIGSFVVNVHCYTFWEPLALCLNVYVLFCRS